ncbi:Sister chromatid cohesion DCC1 [Fusarium phyllophilum]|uniref:Sister chromatid cohesion DCC1 n=1 Tax=Fusarium phyllophilum TaxID=47803 RepID=A0A8H5NDE0_9HYPO|nr:Sister chromatid cohesion DCC1 [Fusarium phyllophilum]
MSSQSSGITVQHNPSPTNYRLIELPPDLLSLLESDDAPVLTMESSDSSAVIKTPTKTYALRQKNTSNALMLLSPTPLPTSSDGPVEQGISIISTIKETVELDTVPDVSSGTAKGLGGGKGKWHERFGRNR